MSVWPHMDQASPGAASPVTSKLVGPGHAETVHASEKFDKAGLLAAHHAELHDAYMLERGLLPGTSLPNSEAPPIPPVYAESPWKDFRLVSLADMKVGKTHRRHALEGRLCATSLKVTSVVNVLEEDSGLATKLILTNALHERASMAQAQNCYPEGSRVTVRDPYLTRFPDGVVGVLVERPSDIAFLSRPESTGDNGHLIYGAVGYDDGRSHSREHENFSRKIHLFEQQMKQEKLAHLESLDSRRMSGMFQRPVAHHRDDQAQVARSSPPKAEAKEVQSPVKEELKAVIAEDTVTLKPIVLKPVPPKSEAPKPVASEPVLLKPVAPKPVAPKPVAPKPVAQEPVLLKPVAPKPIASEPVASKPVASEPVASKSALVEPVASKPAVSEPVAAKPAVSEPVAPKSAVLEPVAAKPAVSEPVAAEAAGSEPVVLQPVVVDRLNDSTTLESPKPAPRPSPVVVMQEEPYPEVAVKEALPSESVEEPTTPKAEERRGVKDFETPEEDSLESVPEAVQKSLELEKEAPAQEDGVPDEPEIAEHPEVSIAVAEVTEVAEAEQAVFEPSVVEASVSSNRDDTSKDQLETLQNGQAQAPEIKKPLVRKKFHRSDSLLAVQEVEDSRARAISASAAALAAPAALAGDAGSCEEPIAAVVSSETEIPESNDSVKVDEAVAPVSKSKSTTTVPPSIALETHSANELRVMGNLMFGEENFAGAADLYTKSIQLAEAEEQRQGKLVRNSEIILGYSNRAEAYIRLQEFGKALADAKKALSRDPSHLKSLFRKGRALLGLSQYEQALTTLQAAAPRAPTDRDLQAALHESSTGVQQSCHGHYDLAHYYLKGKQAGESPFSADYVGPVIVTDVGRGRGRGLLLTKDVEAGELLLVSNPIAFLALQDVDQTRRDIAQAFVDGKVQEGFRHVFETAHHKGLEKLWTLCDGERSLPAPSVHQTDEESGGLEPTLDHARLRRVIQLNAINGDATMGWKNLPGSGEQDKKVEHWGLWWLPSFINHSCLPTSSPILVGKALFLFAARDMRAGEEVTRAYFDIFQPLDQRKELSTKGWGFVCLCPRCKLEDALHNSLSRVTEQYTKLMELASKSKFEFGTDEQLSDTQSSAALKFIHKLESKLKDFKLNAAENNWVRSSFLHYIDMISGDHELHTHLESIVEALVTVCPGSETTLHMAVVAKDSARRTFGKKSPQSKAGTHRALNICRFTYGKQKASVLQAIVDKNDYQS